MQSLKYLLFPKSGYVSTFKVGESCMCTGLVQEDGVIISDLTCWNVDPKERYPYYPLHEKILGYPRLERNSKRTLDEVVQDYADQPKMRRFEIKV